MLSQLYQTYMSRRSNKWITEIVSSSQSRSSLLSEDLSAAIIDESPTSTRKNNNIDNILLERKITPGN
jgi:hypothetical protein